MSKIIVKNRFILLSVLFLVGLFILHFTANMFRNLNHDEHVYVASSLYWLQHGDLPYRDFPHLHLPNLMFVYSLLYIVTDYYLLAARAFSTFCGWLLLVVIYMLPFQLWRDRSRWDRSQWDRSQWETTLIAVCTTALFFLSAIFAYTSGRAWNHDLTVLLVVVAILIHGYALRQPDRYRWLMLSGFLWSFAACTRASSGPAVVAFIGLIWWTQAKMSLRLWMTGYFLFGAIWPSLPTLYLFVKSPGNFIFYNIETHYLNADYLLMMNPNLDTGFLAKIRTFIQYVLYNRLGNFVLFGGYLIITCWAFVRQRNLKKYPEVMLIALVILSNAYGALAPKQVFPQYFYIFFPLFTIGILFGLRAIDLNLNRYIKLPLVLIVTILALFNIPRFEHAHEFLLPEEWLTVKAHRMGETVADLIQHEGSILTVAPIVPLEGGLDIYPQLVAGPIAMRAADVLPLDEREQYGLIGIDQLDEWLGEERPAAIYLNGQNDDAIHENELAAYAQHNEYVALPLKKQEQLWVKPMAQWEDTIQLITYQWTDKPQRVETNSELRLMLFWQAIAPIDRNLTVVIKIVNSVGEVVHQQTAWPWGRPTSDWQIDDIWYDGHTIDLPDLTDGLYRLDVAFYDEQDNRLWQPLASLERHRLDPDYIALDYIIVGDWPMAQMMGQEIEPDIVWQNGATLVAMELDSTELTHSIDHLELTLFWQTRQKIKTNYTIFVHLVRPDGELIAQRDQQPLNDFFPTKIWPTGQPLQDEYVLPLPEKMESGAYQLFVGMYDPLSMQRQLIVNNKTDDSLADIYQIAILNLK